MSERVYCHQCQTECLYDDEIVMGICFTCERENLSDLIDDICEEDIEEWEEMGWDEGVDPITGDEL